MDWKRIFADACCAAIDDMTVNITQLEQTLQSEAPSYTRICTEQQALLHPKAILIEVLGSEYFGRDAVIGIQLTAYHHGKESVSVLFMYYGGG